VGFWSRIFGEPRLPDRVRGPIGEEPGTLKNGKKHGVWVEHDDNKYLLTEALYRDGVREGPFRVWHVDTRMLRERGTMRDGKEHGTTEYLVDGQVRGVTEKVAGKVHGRHRWFRPDGSLQYEREYRDDKMWSGRHDIELSDGVVIQRANYVDGHPVGVFEKFDYKGRPQLREHYNDAGELDGEYASYYEGGGGVRMEGTYTNGKRAGTWRYRLQDGSIGAESDDGTTWRAHGQLLPVPRDDEELGKWAQLAHAWEQLGKSREGYWFHVENAIDALDVTEACAWTEARIAERGDACPNRTTLGRGWIEHLVDRDDDPRPLLIDGISLDHHGWSEEQVARVVRRAHVMRVLSLYECSVEPDADALFPDGVAWPKLEELLIMESGSLAAIVERLATATWTTRLRSLTLYDEDEPLPGEHLATLLHSPHVGALRELVLHVPGAGFEAALATSPVLDRLEHLEIKSPADLGAVVDAIANRAMPELVELTLCGDVKISKATQKKLRDKELRPKLQRAESR
jgi:antitoxin component YwqK of YwqJK toxin-antitoxin module